MGDLFRGKKTSTTDAKPWAPQESALKDIFGKAGDIYNSQAGSEFYGGDLYANMDPQTAAAIQGMLQYTQGQGAANAGRLTQNGQSLADPTNYKGAVDRFATASGVDPTQANIANATAYANNPAIDGMIDAASRDVGRNLYEQEIPGINRAATGTGNMNSSRAGVTQGIAERGAADRVGDISSQIRGQAYDRGLGLSEQARGTNLSALGQSAGMYGQQVGMGMDAIGAGNNMALGNYGAAVDGSSLFQRDQQGQNDADFAKWQGNDTRQSDLLNRYYGLVGANNWGGTQKTTEKSQGSIFGSLMGAASIAAGFSDPRLKENIVKIDELEDGLGVYEYDYIWGEHATGVMADEVAELRPWALGPTRGGFLTVNYAAL